MGLESPFLISDLRKLTSDVCAGRDSPKWARFKKNPEALKELTGRPEYCLDLTFMYSLLSLGYELEDEREIWIGKQVGDVELGWSVSHPYPPSGVDPGPGVWVQGRGGSTGSARWARSGNGRGR